MLWQTVSYIKSQRYIIPEGIVRKPSLNIMASVHFGYEFFLSVHQSSLNERKNIRGLRNCVLVAQSNVVKLFGKPSVIAVGRVYFNKSNVKANNSNISQSVAITISYVFTDSLTPAINV